MSKVSELAAAALKATSLALSLTALTALTVPVAAAASGLQWTQAGIVADNGLACASTSLCLDGTAVSTDPSGPASTWNFPADPADQTGASGVACANSSLCVVIEADNSGDASAVAGPDGEVSYTTTPTDPTSWQPATLVDSLGPGGFPNELDAITCIPGTTTCLFVDASGYAMYSTDPASGNWQAIGLSDPNGPGNGMPNTGISCPTKSLCVISNTNGTLYATTDPTGPATGWNALTPDETFDGMGNETYANEINDVACLSNSQCVAVDDAGNALTSSRPTSSWSAPADIDGSNSINAVACPGTTLCVAVDSSGNVLTAPGPLGSWTSSTIDPSGYLTSVACPSTSLCLATDAGGAIFVGQSGGSGGGGSGGGGSGGGGSGGSGGGGGGGSPGGGSRPSKSAIDTALERLLAPFGAAAGRAELISHGGFTFSFDAPGTGVLAIYWRRARRHGHGEQLIAHAGASVRRSGRIRVDVKLTATCMKLLRHGDVLHVTATATFTPSGGTAVSLSKSFGI